MSSEYDVIVLGAGPNGETVASYLQKAGAKCLLIEKRHELGGGLITENFGGFRFNLHALYMMMAELMPPYVDLNLTQYGCMFIRPEAQLSLLLRDKALTLYCDPEKSAKSIGKFSQGDAGKYLKMWKEFKELCDECLVPATYAPAAPPAEYAAMLSSSEIGRRVLEISEMSALEVLEGYGFEDERVKAAILYLGCLWGITPDLTGVGFMFPIFVYRMTNVALLRGGTHRLSSSLSRAYYENKGEVLESTSVKKILVKDGAAQGVELEDGKKIMAKAVVSTLNPHQTFLELVGADNISEDLAASVREWKWEDWSLFAVHLGVKGLPSYRADKDDPDCNKALVQLFGYESVEDVVNHWRDCANDSLPPPKGHVTCVSQFDTSQAPKGYHTVRLETQAPYEVTGKDWEEIKDQYGEELVETWKGYLANTADVKIVKKYAYPPTYVEKKLISMTRGSIKHGAYIATQMGYFRPNIDCSNYRTPITGLYVAGASTYPGGMITLGPGYVASSMIAADLGLNPWWKLPDSVVKAREKGLVP